MNHFSKISNFTQIIGIKPPEHPLFCISHGTKFSCNKSDDIEFTADFYIIGLKKLESGSILYGKTKYDHDLGKMSFIKPRQIVAFKNIRLEEDCFLVLVHEDFLSGHSLHHDIKKYSFFEYEVNEALHLSPSEEETIWSLAKIMEKEYYNNVDDYSKSIILSHLDTMLKYSQRFYKRQFIEREDLRGATFTKFNDLLSQYFENKDSDTGLPTVSYMAEKLNLSSRYLTDLLKQETGKTALELIHLYLISEAKNLLKEGKMNISEISVSLGFENATYFSRLFKKEVGITPNIFREQNLN
ncbi:AraC family transcriptional activator of pobA [Chryseobacterium ginsenosidimutans]|uniref:helix-turn-helix domain-containing protein n=1 Tax=Chryseobacterium ginsenosidimutans TaxID=687846 RepID=UPI002783749F|nr:helix-turn-helix transcriptional regulator [Chryseobacterium ginsenosidimutans]MDQ0593315.1 AraC family transcriptional activator of pobA [Chryseobacterium ginsenosidimutans]